MDLSKLFPTFIWLYRDAPWLLYLRRTAIGLVSLFIMALPWFEFTVYSPYTEIWQSGPLKPLMDKLYPPLIRTPIQVHQRYFPYQIPDSIPK